MPVELEQRLYQRLCPDWQTAYEHMTERITPTVRASSAVECMNSVVRVLTDGSAQRQAAEEQVVSFKTQAQRDVADADYYDVLAKQSRKLQNRVADIAKALAFQGDGRHLLELSVSITEDRGS
jgi:cation diffusion facilitator CzcD-associated flavoprotein CzcO